MNATTTNRYFAYIEDLMDIELTEVTKAVFDQIEGETTTERHTMFEHGVNQICHTKDNT